jgi:hypothetical protein
MGDYATVIRDLENIWLYSFGTLLDIYMVMSDELSQTAKGVE